MATRMRAGSASFQNDGHMIGFGLLQVLQHEIVAPLMLRSFDDGCFPFLRTTDNPMVELVGNLGEGPTGYPFPIPIGVEEPQYQLWDTDQDTAMPLRSRWEYDRAT
jgi:hypothetical protein